MAARSPAWQYLYALIGVYYWIAGSIMVKKIMGKKIMSKKEILALERVQAKSGVSAHT